MRQSRSLRPRPRAPSRPEKRCDRPLASTPRPRGGLARTRVRHNPRGCSPSPREPRGPRSYAAGPDHSLWRCPRSSPAASGPRLVAPRLSSSRPPSRRRQVPDRVARLGTARVLGWLSSVFSVERETTFQTVTTGLALQDVGEPGGEARGAACVDGVLPGIAKGGSLPSSGTSFRRNRVVPRHRGQRGRQLPR